MNACIIGASGYSGRELVSLLAVHPNICLSAVTSRSLAGSPVEVAQSDDLDIFFLALPHGTAAEYASPLVEAGKRVIDLSADFRLSCPKLYEEFYGAPHPAPELLEKAMYGLPELHELTWEKSKIIASPGCYPTSILVPLAPLLEAGLVEREGIVINSFSGVSGAGRQASEKLLYCERNESAAAYGLPKHRHLSEIEEQLGIAGGEEVVVSFHPHLAPMSRGIATTVSVPAKGKPDTQLIEDCWKQKYAGRPFTQILPSGEFPDVAHVNGTNRIDFSVVADGRTGRYILTSAEDNLLKGAGGQAVQAMNVCSGFEETAGLP
jgi:N-acetyl-gamma-glutamyl-phosphate reductase